MPLPHRILISAGPMRTPMDPVRYVQNRSSGKMGLALARAAQQAGAQVRVLLGPIEDSVRQAFAPFEPVCYTEPGDYRRQLESLFPECDAFLSLAAVLDFELVPFPHKLDREHISRHDSLTFPIRPVPDFVAAMASRRRPDQRVIAFAAESGTDAEILARAESKRQRKQVEAIVANPVRPGLGPESDRNELWVIRPDRPVEHLGPAPKTELARPLLKSLFG